MNIKNRARLGRALAVSLCVWGLGSPASAQLVAKSILAKKDSTPQQLAQDEKACEAFAKGARENTYSSQPGGVAGGLMVAALTDGNILSAAKAACLNDRGWADVPLTKQEAKALNSLSNGPERQAWIKTFYAGDIGECVQQNLKEPFSLLPTTPNKPYVIGGVVIDKGSIAAHDAPLKKGELLLSGSVSRLPTGTVQADYHFRQFNAKKGDVFHQLDYSFGGNPAPEWCTVQAKPRWPWCIMGLDNHYSLGGRAGTPWLASPYFGGGNLKSIEPFKLKINQGDAPVVWDFRLEILSVKKDGVGLKMVVVNSGERSVIWSDDVAFDAQGRASLPFWDQVVVLDRSAGGLRTSLADATTPKPPPAPSMVRLPTYFDN